MWPSIDGLMYIITDPYMRRFILLEATEMTKMEIVIDMINIETASQLHRLLKEKIGFSDYW